MSMRGELNGECIDNTTEAEIRGWIEALRQICPQQVRVYTIGEILIKALYKVSKEELEAIADGACK